MPLEALIRALAPRPRYVVVPFGYRRPVRHAAATWSEALEWARCYPDGEPQPLIFDLRSGRAVRYVR